jgi:3-deoxy-D-manno-octulosonate 8-phosphate phosphatase (KDO 8-P phosphatase)
MPDERSLFAPIRLLALDIDGTLTDGRTSWLGEAIGWVQAYSVRDGESILALVARGIHVVPVSRNKTRCARERMLLLGLPTDWLGVAHKLEAIHEVSSAYATPMENICYVGDGPEDVPVLQAVGVPCTVRDGCPEALQVAKFVTRAMGGAHAIAEIAYEIRAAQP